MQAPVIDIEKLKQGDSSAQRDFWERHFNEVLAICSKILGPGADATDIATDLLSDFLFNYVHNLSNPNGYRAYLRIMAVRRSLRRKQKAHQNISFDEMELPSKEHVTPEEDASVSLLLPKLSECLSTLTPKAQSVVRLKYTKQMTNEHIGQTVGGSKQYIGRLLTQSLDVLLNCLQKGAFAQ